MRHRKHITQAAPRQKRLCYAQLPAHALSLPPSLPPSHLSVGISRFCETLVISTASSFWLEVLPFKLFNKGTANFCSQPPVVLCKWCFSLQNNLRRFLPGFDFCMFISLSWKAVEMLGMGEREVT